MQFDGALVKEQGVCFAIAVVKPHVLNSTNKETVRNGFRQYFGQVPVILMAQNARGTPIYDGRRDIVNFLAGIHPSRIPWKRYTISQ